MNTPTNEEILALPYPLNIVAMYQQMIGKIIRIVPAGESGVEVPTVNISHEKGVGTYNCFDACFFTGEKNGIHSLIMQVKMMIPDSPLFTTQTQKGCEVISRRFPGWLLTVVRAKQKQYLLCQVLWPIAQFEKDWNHAAAYLHEQAYVAIGALTTIYGTVEYALLMQPAHSDTHSEKPDAEDWLPHPLSKMC